MSDKFLSQEEINELLKKEESIKQDAEEELLSGTEKDILGEVGNISMSTSATTLSTLLNRKVAITTPRVNVTTFNEVVESFQMPYVILQVQFEDGLHGTNVLMMSIKDASIIASLMMGQDGTTYNEEALSEIELSAVSEAMNQMIGSASTAVSTMLGKRVDINPPTTQVGNHNETIEVIGMTGDEKIACTVFNMSIDELIDSEIMQLYAIDTVKEIAGLMMGSINTEAPTPEPQQDVQPEPQPIQQTMEPQSQDIEEVSTAPQPQVQKPQFVPLNDTSKNVQSRNIDLILDVPLEMSAILGRAQKSIKEVLALEPGSIIELNKHAEEPLDIYVNGKFIAQGEVVVVDEKFGIRINTIISPKERVEFLK